MTRSSGTAHAADTPLRDLGAAKGKVVGTAVTAACTGTAVSSAAVSCTNAFNGSGSGSNPVPTVTLG